MEKQKNLFLDTATLIARHWHCDTERKAIAGQLSGCKLYSSKYVLCQYKATLLNAIIALHNLLLRHKDIHKAIQESKYYPNREAAGVPLKRGMQERISEVGLCLARHYTMYEEQIERLELWIEDIWEAHFRSDLEEPLIDETGCCYADDAPEKGVSGYYRPVGTSCTLTEPRACGILGFWKKHEVQLEVLRDMVIDDIVAVPKDKEQLGRVKEAAGRIFGGESAQGQRCTVHLSDAVICTEATHTPPPRAVHSINKKDFRPLAEMLGIESVP